MSECRHEWEFPTGFRAETKSKTIRCKHCTEKATFEFQVDSFTGQTFFKKTNNEEDQNSENDKID